MKLYKKIIICFVIIVSFCISYLIVNYFYNTYFLAPKIEVLDTIISDDNQVIVKYKLLGKSLRRKVYYIIRNNDKYPLSNDSDWKISDNDSFTFDLDKNIYYAYLKNEDGQIYNVSNVSEIGKITYLTVDKNVVYLPIGGTYTPSLTYDGIGKVENKITYKIDNEKIASVYSNGVIKGLRNGKTKLTISIMNKSISIDIYVSKLIVNKPKEYNYNKPYLTCEIHSKSDNDLLDTILKDRISTVGYKTRAGVVEAARFLALEFPYRITYFSENGRGATNGVDGEGRYYHKGLYLHNSRYSDIKKTMHGPSIWGCRMYSNPAHGYRRNGFDCSGFISWVLLNGGFDVKDVGAGLSSSLDLTDYGVRKVFTRDLITKKKIKVGDLLSSGGVSGGHIAIIVGETNNYYYVAESLWTSPNVGVVIVPYSKKTIYNTYYYVMLMDSYYKKDGNLTKMWY